MFYIVILMLTCASAHAALPQKAFNNNYPKDTPDSREQTYTDLGTPVGRLGLTQEQIDEIQEQAHERLQMLTGERPDAVADMHLLKDLVDRQQIEGPGDGRIGEIGLRETFAELRSWLCCCCKRKKE